MVEQIFSFEPTLRKPSRDVTDFVAKLPEDFRLESGELLKNRDFSMRIFGDPAAPAIIVLGGISADRRVADGHDGVGWWRKLVRPGGAIDLQRYCVISADYLPGESEGLKTVSTHDQARALFHGLNEADIRHVSAFIGASYGGMVGLAFAELFPAHVDRLITISAPARAHPAATALRGIQRRVIRFAQDCGRPADGVSLARQIGMTSYRTPQEFKERFSGGPRGRVGSPTEVCEYLISRGAACGLTPDRYLVLSDSIDRHAVDASRISTPTTIVAVDEDGIVPVEQLRELLAGLAGPAQLISFSSVYGHDAFLKEINTLGAIIEKTLSGDQK